MSNRKEMLAKAKAVGLFVGTWSPGDGVTRYRFFEENIDYFAGDGIYTALGAQEALVFVRGYCRGRLVQS